MEWEQLRKRLRAKSGDLERLQQSALFVGVPSEALLVLGVGLWLVNRRRIA